MEKMCKKILPTTNCECNCLASSQSHESNSRVTCTSEHVLVGTIFFLKHAGVGQGFFCIFVDFWVSGPLLLNTAFFAGETCFLSSSRQKHAEPLWNYLKNSILETKCAKFDQKSDFGHVRTYCWLNTLRNIQRKYMEYMWIIFREHIWNL